MLIILLLICEDGMLRVADPSYVEACQQHNISRYYNCDIYIGDPNVLNDPTWLTCPTYIGTEYTGYNKYNKIVQKVQKRYLSVYCSIADYHIQLGTYRNCFCRNSKLVNIDVYFDMSPPLQVDL